MKESVCEPVELRRMSVGVCELVEGRSMQESVCESGEPGSMQGSVGESGKPGSMHESVCESGESVWGLSLRALRARTGGGHVSAQLWTKFGTSLDKLGNNLEQIWE